MAMGYTHKGTQWEYQQSWYLLALFTPWTFWFPLVYTGLRTLQFRWIIWGLFYGLPAFITMVFNPADFGVEGFFKRWVFAALVIAAIHAFRARGEFLVRLAGDTEVRELLMEGARMRREMAEQASRGGTTVDDITRQPEEIPQQGEADAAISVPTPAPAPMRRRFDVNLIGERELAMLPGMGPTRARQAVALRESLGGFHSFDHFAEKVGFAADERERLRPIFLEAAPASPSWEEYTVLPDGRHILEINLASAAALATLPGIDHELARRAVSLRGTDGPYASTEDFRFRLGLPVEALVQLAPVVSTIKTPARAAALAGSGGRVVDASSATGLDPGSIAKPSGRIVDL